MRTAIASVVTAVASSICCLGPVAMVTLGGGAIAASLAAWEPYRPVFLVTTAALLGVAFYTVYRPQATCSRGSRRTVWVAMAFVIALVMFPYYVGLLF